MSMALPEALVDALCRLPTLQVGDITLRDATEADEQDIAAYRYDKSLYTHYGTKPPRRKPFAPHKLGQKAQDLTWYIQYRGRIVGECFVWRIVDGRMGAVGYIIAKDAQGKGVAGRAVSAMILHCLTELPFTRLYAQVSTANPASARVLEKAGFAREGLVRQGKMMSVYCDHWIYGILREDVVK